MVPQQRLALRTATEVHLYELALLEILNVAVAEATEAEEADERQR